MPIYKIISIAKQGDLTEADTARIDRRVTIESLREGFRALLLYADSSGKGLLTSKVKEISGKNGDNILEFTTENTTYVLRKVDVN